MHTPFLHIFIPFIASYGVGHPLPMKRRVFSTMLRHVPGPPTQWTTTGTRGRRSWRRPNTRRSEGRWEQPAGHRLGKWWVLMRRTA